eukprot:8164797-Heterocapsa_arctica.AAC.1
MKASPAIGWKGSQFAAASGAAIMSGAPTGTQVKAAPSRTRRPKWSLWTRSASVSSRKGWTPGVGRGWPMIRGTDSIWTAHPTTGRRTTHG